MYVIEFIGHDIIRQILTHVEDVLMEDCKSTPMNHM